METVDMRKRGGNIEEKVGKENQDKEKERKEGKKWKERRKKEKKKKRKKRIDIFHFLFYRDFLYSWLYLSIPDYLDA